eukprot:TRINITY_DN6766_c0_g2_i3.p1 TRINITY_DN6766_c0_g2~~TRINITY_DN6766_c0_g2_i3.p1  ORF type:complete len:717 (-),score=206.66 TRINITY_DN6766_c0_g2_i3:50-2200(-)
MKKFFPILFIILANFWNANGDEYSPVARPTGLNTFQPGATFVAEDFLTFVTENRNGGGGSQNVVSVGVKPGAYNVTGTLPIVMKSMYNITIWMDGVTLIVPDNTKTFLSLEQVGPLSIRGLTLSFATSASQVGRVTAVDSANAKVTVQVEAGYDISKFSAVNYPFGHFDPSGRLYASPNLGQLYPTQYQSVSANTFIWTLYIGQASQVSVGDLVGVPSVVPGAVGANKPVFTIVDCESIGFVDVTVSNTMGIVWSELGGLGGHYYTRVKVIAELPTGHPFKNRRAPLLSSIGVYVLKSQGTKTGPSVSYSLFEGVDKDVIFVHGARTKPSSGAGTTTLNFPSGAVPFEWENGDSVRFYNSATQLIGSGTIKSKTTTSVTFNAVVPTATVYAASSTHGSAGFKMTYSTIRYSGGVALTLAAQNALISDCIFNATVSAGIYAGPFFENPPNDQTFFDNALWSDFASGLTLQRNLFNSVGYSDLGIGHGAITVQAYQGTTSTKANAAGGFSSINIINNTVAYTNSESAISVTSTNGIVVKGNNVVAPQGTTKVINLEKVATATVDSNCVYVFSSSNPFYVLDGTASSNPGVQDCTNKPNPNGPVTSGVPSFPTRTDTPPTGIYASSSAGTTASDGGNGSNGGGSNGGGNGSSPTGNTVPPPTISYDASSRVTTTNPATPDASGFYPPTDATKSGSLATGGVATKVYSLFAIALGVLIMM